VGDLLHELREKPEQTRLDFIRTDLEVCLTLADLAETKYSMLQLLSQANNLTAI